MSRLIFYLVLLLSAITTIVLVLFELLSVEIKEKSFLLKTVNKVNKNVEVEVVTCTLTKFVTKVTK